MRIDKLFEYLKSNIKAGTSPFMIESVEINYGDRYYNENGEDLSFEILGKKYSVGYSYITEDADDWAQAECYSVDWCRCDDKEVSTELVYNIVINYKSEVRDTLLNQII